VQPPRELADKGTGPSSVLRPAEARQHFAARASRASQSDDFARETFNGNFAQAAQAIVDFAVASGKPFAVRLPPRPLGRHRARARDAGV